MENNVNSLEKVVTMLNECGTALNRLDHDLARKTIGRITSRLNNTKAPLDIVFYWLQLCVELAKRTGLAVEETLKDINRYIEEFRVRPDLHFRLLMMAGRLEAQYSRLNISTKYLTEALGIPEGIGDKRMIAQAYSAIARMFSPLYPGLAFYFYRKAERNECEAGNIVEAEVDRMERALLSLTCFLNNRSSKYERLQVEADRIVDSLKTDGFNAHQKTRFRYIRAFVKADEDELIQLAKGMRKVGALPDACRFGEVCIGICLEKGLFDKANRIFEVHKHDLIQNHGDSDRVRSHIAGLEHVISNSIVSQYVPYSITKSKDEPTTILDILDKYAFADEIWALEGGWLRQMFSGYNQEGCFDAIRMPDNTVRLYPCGIAFNVYYRGQSDYYENSFPSLYREIQLMARFHNPKMDCGCRVEARI